MIKPFGNLTVSIVEAILHFGKWRFDNALKVLIASRAAKITRSPINKENIIEYRTRIEDIRFMIRLAGMQHANV